MAVNTDMLAGYLRLPPDCSEDLSVFLSAARSKARAAGVPDFQHNAQYDQFILALAALYYDERGLAFSGNAPTAAAENARNLINSFVLELRYATEDPEAVIADE